MTFPESGLRGRALRHRAGPTWAWPEHGGAVRLSERGTMPALERTSSRPSTPPSMAAKRSYWLLKSEPDVFSFDHLWKAKGRRTCWDGVRNYTARNFMRDEMKVGDGVLYYHSNADPPGVAGVAKVVKEGYPDPTQFDPKDAHFDPKADPQDPRWFMVDIKGLAKAATFVPLVDLKDNAKLVDMALVQRGQRLSVQPVMAREWHEVLRMAGLEDKIVL